MNHDEAARLLTAYQDGELDVQTAMKLEEHIAGCPACREQLAAQQELVGFIQAETPRSKAPPFLATRIRAALREERGAAESPGPLPLLPKWLLPTFATGIVAILLLAIATFRSQQVPEVAQDAIANHVRSLQVNHLMDVASTDQHTVKPWFAGKLDYSPQVIDLTPSGYPLIGGRLDVLDHRNVAAIVYQRRKHYINLFIWPATAHAVPDRLYDENGYHAIGWSKSGMNYLAVSELGARELKDFAGMIQEQTVDSRPGE